MKSVFIKPLETKEEVKQLDKWRKDYWDADLEVPHDFSTGDGHVDTAVGVKDGKMFCSLTALDAVVLDPFIHDPSASNHDLFSALLKLETALCYNAQKKGAMDAYIAVPNTLVKYMKLLENYGWQPTVQNCTVFRRPLRPDTVPLLGPERDELERLVKEAKALEAQKAGGKVENSKIEE